MNCKPDSLYGATAVAVLRSYAGPNCSASLGINTAIGIFMLRSEFVIYKNGKIWHQSTDPEDALKQYQLVCNEATA